MEERQICPWCMTEIVWDEELGPEENCPHCDNELGGYRTVGLHMEPREDDGDDDAKEGVEDWSEEEESGRQWAEDDGYIRTDRSMLAAEGTIRRLIDEQDEAPECPACREYMLEAGTQTIGGPDFRPAVPEALGHPIVPGTMNLNWYVCPSCYQVSSVLAPTDRAELLKRLTSNE